jgi:hypothetical protein
MHEHEPAVHESGWLDLLRRPTIAVALAIGFVLFLTFAFWPDPSYSDPVDVGQHVGEVPHQFGNRSVAAPRATGFLSEDFQSLLARNPRLAARHVADIEEGDPERDVLLSTLMGTWAASDPSGAAVWLSGLPSGAFRGDATQELAAAWGRLTPGQTAQWAGDELARGRPMAASALLSVWGSHHPEQAAQWLDDLHARDDLPQKSLVSLSGALAYAWGQVDGASATAWAAEHADRTTRSQALSNAAASWAQSDPKALADWVPRHLEPDEPSFLAVHVTLAAHWATVSPKSAGRWALAISEPELRDTTLASFASSLAMDHPPQALEWVGSIHDFDMRTNTRLDIYDTWLEDNLPAGRAALIAQLPQIPDTSERRALYALLHEKDPVFRAELYNLVDETSADETSAQETAPVGEPAKKPEPKVRKAIPVLEDLIEVEELAK